MCVFVRECQRVCERARICYGLGGEIRHLLVWTHSTPAALAQPLVANTSTNTLCICVHTLPMEFVASIRESDLLRDTNRRGGAFC